MTRYNGRVPSETRQTTGYDEILARLKAKLAELDCESCVEDLPAKLSGRSPLTTQDLLAICEQTGASPLALLSPTE